jgi:ATP-dependent DNA helicase RecG
MSSILPIGIEELLPSQAVESARLEFKASWSAKVTGPQVLETLCAFANDLQNLNGGYIVIGVAEQDGVAERPVKGLDAKEIDVAQKWVRGNCKRIKPVISPVMSPETVDGSKLLVVWMPASDSRPHQGPSNRDGKLRYFVHIGSETVEAQGSLLDQLIQLTARVPFDDRRAIDAQIEDLREGRVREFLKDVRSGLAQERDIVQIYHHLYLTRPVNSHYVPRNVALLFFTDDPESWFRGARVEVAQFADDAGGNTIEEQVFRGPIHEQLRQCLSMLENLATHHLEKVNDRSETRGWVSYPSLALREALVNALYHRSYDEVLEPTKVFLYPDRIEIISYPGPVPGIELEHLSGVRPLPPVPARNRRIGELLKELRLAEARGTGVPKIYRSMEENGSPRPHFDFDTERTYFRVTLPAHPEYVAISALRDAAYLKATANGQRAIERLLQAWASNPESALLAAALIRDYASLDDLDGAKSVYESVMARQMAGKAGIVAAMADAYLVAGRRSEAVAVLDAMPDTLSVHEATDAAITERRARRSKRAHHFFEKASDGIFSDVRALHEFAQTKLDLTHSLAKPPHTPGKRDVRKRLLQEAEALLDRVVQLDAPPTRHSWAWYNLGQVRTWLRKPQASIIEAYEKAHELNPDERKIADALDRARQY